MMSGEFEYMGKRFKIAELPNMDDLRVLAYMVHVQRLHDVAQELIKRAIDKNREVEVTIGIVAGVLMRIVECVGSILLLAMKGRSRDVAVLLLNVMELRVDLEYIALKEEREREWIDHENQWRKPWNFDRELKDICSDKGELEAEQEIYHHLSMIKHGSPAADHEDLPSLGRTSAPNLAFEVFITTDRLLLVRGRTKGMLPGWLFLAGSNVYAACMAGLRILRRHGVDLPRVGEDLKLARSELRSLFDAQIAEKLVELARLSKGGQPSSQRSEPRNEPGS